MSETALPGSAATPASETRSHWMAPVLVALIGVFMSILDTSIVNVAISTIMTVFNTDTATVEWVSTAYMLALGMVVPMSAWLGDKLGVKNLYIWSLAAFVGGSLLCTLSWDIESLIFARVIQALGGGMLMPSTMAMVYRMVPRDKIGGGMGIFGIALLVAPALGPTLGGWLVEYVDWRWIFTINLPIGVVGILLAFFVLPDFPKVDAGKFDLAGAVTAALGFSGLLYVLSKGSEWGWGSENTVLFLFGSLSFITLFVIIELTSPNPLLDLRVFKYASFTFANIAVVLTTIGMFAGLFYIPLFLQTVRGLGAMETGILMMPGALASGIMMPIVGKLYDKIGPRALMVTGLAFLTFLTWHFHNLNLETSLTTLTWWIVFRGLFMSMANMPAQTAAMADLPTELVGRASAVTSIIRNIASSFGIALMTALLHNRSAFYTVRMGEMVTAGNTGLAEMSRRIVESGASGMAEANASALRTVQGHIAQMAFVKGVQDIFIIAAVLTLVGLVPALFLKKAKTPAGSPGSEAAMAAE